MIMCVCFFFLFALIVTGCNSVQSSSFGSDNGGPPLSVIQNACGGPLPATYIGKGGGVDLITSSNPTGSGVIAGPEDYGLNITDLADAVNNADPFNNGGENTPVNPPGGGLAWWMGGPAYLQHLEQTQPAVAFFYWGPMINKVAQSVQSIFEQQGYTSAESTNLASDYGFGYTQGYYASQAWAQVTNTYNLNLEFNVMWADIENGNTGLASLAYSTGSNGWLIPYDSQYIEYQNISIYNGFVQGLFAGVSTVSIPSVDLYPGMYSSPSNWNYYTGGASLTTLTWTPALSQSSLSSCPSNTSYFSGLGYNPTFPGNESTTQNSALEWQFVSGANDLDQVNLDHYEADLNYLQGGCGNVVAPC